MLSSGRPGAVPVQGQPRVIIFRACLAPLIRRDMPAACRIGLRFVRTSLATPGHRRKWQSFDVFHRFMRWIPMLETFTLDQLRALIAVSEEGSFSAAARKLHRVQSAVSTAMANLETQLGIPLWDRATKTARLTDHGHAVVAAARKVCTEVDGLRKLAVDLGADLSRGGDD